jgi:iron complex outermembrane receptor protein
MTYLKPLISYSALFAATVSFSALAQEPESAEAGFRIEQITVTAQRREQSLQDVPIAVSAFTSEALDKFQINATTSLMQIVPNLSGGEVSGAGSANNYSMRGLYNAETAATFDSPVGTYVDGIFMARLNANNFALFEVERIEVLRGPQGTLFGRNTTGGAINVIMKKPAEEFGGFVEGTIGNYEQYQLRGALDIPLSNNVRSRIAAYVLEEDGWVDNLTKGGTENAHDGWGVRGSLGMNVNDNITWDIAIDYSLDDNPNIPATKMGDDYTSQSGLTKLSNLFPGKKGQIDGNTAENETWGITSNIGIELSFGDLELITGYRDLTSRFSLDYFNGPAPTGGYVSLQYSTHKQFTQEAKLSGDIGDRLSYTTGLFYFYEDNKTDFSTVFTLPNGFPFIDADRILLNDTTSLAAYAQADYELTEKLSATVGARFTHDEKEIGYVDNGNPLAFATITDDVLTNAGIPLELNASVLTPRFALQYRPDQDFMFFISATRGFKSGGWNVRGTNANTLQEFNAEKIWSYEAGIRAEMLDNRLQVNLTTFYGDTSDLQIATASTGPTGAPQFPVGNFAGLESYGFELEVSAVPARGLTIGGNLGFNETNYQDLSQAVLDQQAACLSGATANCGGGIVEIDGDIAPPARSPKWTGTIFASYEAPLSNDWQLVPSISGRYNSSFNTNAAWIPAGYDDGYFMINGGIALQNPNENVSLEVGCTNCNDTTYLLTTIGGRFWYNEPRRIYGRVRVGF